MRKKSRRWHRDSGRRQPAGSVRAAAHRRGADTASAMAAPSGSGPGADIQIDHPTVSTLHATTEYYGPYVVLADLGLSANGCPAPIVDASNPLPRNVSGQSSTTPLPQCLAPQRHKNPPHLSFHPRPQAAQKPQSDTPRIQRRSRESPPADRRTSEDQATEFHQ